MPMQTSNLVQTPNMMSSPMTQPSIMSSNMMQNNTIQMPNNMLQLNMPVSPDFMQPSLSSKKSQNDYSGSLSPRTELALQKMQ